MHSKQIQKSATQNQHNNPLKTMSIIKEVLEHLKSQSQNTTEQGNAFERLTKLFLQDDKTFSPQFSEVQMYADWAKTQGLPSQDIGIDLVAKNKHDKYYTAIQCKFYDADSAIDKKGIDSFIAASGSKEFNRCLFVDTTTRGISTNVETVGGFVSEL